MSSLPFTTVLVVSLLGASTALALGPQGIPDAGPEELVEALVTAARQDDPSSLAGYCHPSIETDGDVAEICALTKESEGWESFVEWFRTGVLAGPVELEGGVARVPVRFGPEGDRVETMELQLWGERWYLRAF